MAFDESLADRIRHILKPMGNEILEKKMFGGITFLYRGKMTVGVVKDDLCVRFLEDKYPNMMEREFVRPMDFTKKALKEFAYVHQDGIQNDEDLKYWIQLGIEHAKSKL